jgi:hypothetical protein
VLPVELKLRWIAIHIIDNEAITTIFFEDFAGW